VAPDVRDTVAHLLTDVRTAALGTLRGAEPAVAMVLFATRPDATLVLHLSLLGRHTQDLLRDPRVSLLIAEPDTGTHNPQVLARVTIQATAEPIGPDDPDHPRAEAAYRAKYPTAAVTFSLGDFLLVRLRPHAARLVAGFAQAYDLTPDDLRAALAPA
jgi:putative heme iron utilization protein